MDKKLQETLGEVIGETQDTPKTDPKETDGELSTKGGETKSGDTPEPEYVSGIDISDVPEEQKTVIRDLLSKKASLLEKGYQGKFQKVAALEKVVEDLKNKDITFEEAQQAIDDLAYRKRNPQANLDKKEAKKTLDAMIDGAPTIEQKEALKNLRTMIAEETNIADLKKELEGVKNLLNGMYSSNLSTREVELNKELDSLSSVYGKSVVDKYREVVVSSGLKYKDTAKGLLFKLMPSDELEEMLLSKDKRTKEKLKSTTSNGSGITSSIEHLDIKKSSLGQVLRSAMGVKNKG